MKKILAILVGLSVMSFVLAGCSGGGDAAAKDATPKAADTK